LATCHKACKVACNKFRADLYYRIAGIIYEIPSLHQRRTDIPELANALLQRMASRDDPCYRLTDDATEVLAITTLVTYVSCAISCSTPRH